MRSTALSALLLITIAPPALAGDVRFTFTGTVGALSPAPTAGPLAGVSIGDPVSIRIDVDVPATAGIPGFTAGYSMDTASSGWTVGGATGGFALGGVLLFNGFINGEDWVRALNQQIAPSERLDIALDDLTGTVFGSPDVLAEFGVYPASFFITDTFEFTAGDGGVVEVTFAQMEIAPLGLGATYCSPAVVNSSGGPAVVTALGSANVAANDLTLVGSDLPRNSFGYFIASQTQGHVMNAGGSQGTLCLGGSVGRFNAQVMSSGASGVISIDPDLNAFPQPTGLVSVSPGETWSFQAWYRDANPTVTSNFTDGVAVTFL